MEHDVVPLGERHAPHNFEYADETARLAATITDSKWVNALALQLDDGSYWRVASVSPATWEPVGAAGGTPAWADITGKPSTFPPSTHSHVVSDVTDLQDELDAKQATLVNQVNIKSINGVSLLGAGNMTISGGGGGSSAWADITGTPTTLTGYGITDAEPSIAKATGYAKWTGSAWSFSNETYMQTSHDANAVTAAAISNWNAAYEWGDHATAGYTSNLGTVTAVAALTLGTSGTDVGSSVATGTSTPVITLNIPTASAINRGALSSTDWSTFNGKQAALGYTPANVSNNLSDLTNAGTARTNLGLGTLATQSGTFSGTSSGTNTGDQATIPGNAGTATVLQTARTIDGVSFNGSVNITVLAPATHAATGKTTPDDADELPISDGAASYALKKVTFANLKAWVFGFVLATVNVFTKAQRGAFVTLTDASTIAIDLSLSNQYQVVLGGNRTLGVPTNVGAGQQGQINVWQDMTGTRTLAYSWFWGWSDGTARTLSTTKCAKDMLAYAIDYYDTGTFTVTIATPGVFTRAAHGYISGMKCQLSTTGALPTGLTVATTYYVRVIDANTFNLCTSLANVGSATYIATTGSQSGTHTIICGSGTLALSPATP